MQPSKRTRSLHLSSTSGWSPASIEGQSAAFPKCDELNSWFKQVGKAAMEKGLEYVSWWTPGGSFIRQEYRKPTTKQITPTPWEEIATGRSAAKPEPMVGSSSRSKRAGVQ